MAIIDITALVDYEPIDVIAQMKEDILVQYKDSPNLLSYIEALLTPFDELEQVLTDILNLRLISNATGAQLDILGELVGQRRGVYNTQTVKFFGMDPVGGLPVAHKGLGEITDPETGGLLRDIKTPIAARAYLDDVTYRKVIVAKAWKNGYLRGVESLIVSLQILFELGGNMIEIVPDYTTSTDPFVTVTINRELSTTEKSIILLTDVIPSPGGHRYEYYDINGPI